jgi:hypothetical protein
VAEGDAKKDPKNLLVGGAIVAALGVGMVMLLDNDDVGCKVTATGVAVIASGLTHGRPTTQIVADAVAGIGAAEVCAAIIDKMRDEPEERVALEVVTSQGSGEVPVTGLQLTRSAPRTTCDDWWSAEYQVACANGQLGPPIFDLNPGSPTCADWLLPSFVEMCRQGNIGPPAEE